MNQATGEYLGTVKRSRSCVLCLLVSQNKRSHDNRDFGGLTRLHITSHKRHEAKAWNPTKQSELSLWEGGGEKKKRRGRVGGEVVPGEEEGGPSNASSQISMIDYRKF